MNQLHRRCRAKRCGNVAVEGNTLCGACLTKRRPTFKRTVSDDRSPSQLTPSSRPEFSIGGNTDGSWLEWNDQTQAHDRVPRNDHPASDTPGLSSR